MKRYTLQELRLGTGWPPGTRFALLKLEPILDIDDLICPICGEKVRGEPPSDGTDAQWSHTDGTPLCSDREPIERDRG